MVEFASVLFRGRTFWNQQSKLFSLFKNFKNSFHNNIWTALSIYYKVHFIDLLRSDLIWAKFALEWYLWLLSKPRLLRPLVQPFPPLFAVPTVGFLPLISIKLIRLFFSKFILLICLTLIRYLIESALKCYLLLKPRPSAELRLLK